MSDKIGLLLVNLGSPDAPNTKSVRKYLFEFLHDHRVIELTRWLWCPILHFIILRVRPAKSARAYAKIWGQAGGKIGGEAPLVAITRAQAAGVQAKLGERVHVDIAMRYGNPSIKSAIEKMMAAGITKIGVLPLYPQYAAATTASIYDGVFKALKHRRNMPELRFLRDYHTHPDYIAAIGDSITQHLAGLEWEPDKILASFHGLPQEMVDKGDPYQSECARSTDLISDYLGDLGQKLMLTFQSRFGPKAWLQPYTDKTLKAFPEQAITKVIVITPGFSADCLETLEEIAIEAGEDFIEAGGTDFSVVPCLNDSEAHIALLTKLARQDLLSNWLKDEQGLS